MQKNVRDLLDSKEFKGLVTKRASVSIVLLVFLFVSYYGFILLIGFDKSFLAQKISETGVTTIGIPLAVAVILAAWFLTVIYVVWANMVYDPEVRRLRALLLGK